MSDVCRECREDLDHCHGTLVHHASFFVECTDDCATPDGLHSFAVQAHDRGRVDGSVIVVATVVPALLLCGLGFAVGAQA